MEKVIWSTPWLALWLAVWLALWLTMRMLRSFSSCACNSMQLKASGGCLWKPSPLIRSYLIPFTQMLCAVLHI